MTTQDRSPLSYLGVKESNPPNVVYFDRNPLPINIAGFDIGDIWINTLLRISWQLLSKAGGVADWQQVGGGTAQVSTLTADVGGTCAPTNGDIVITGNSGQGVITTKTAVSTLQVTVQDATTIAKGVVNLATNAEAIAGTDTAKAVTSDDLRAKLGVQTVHGVLIGSGTANAVVALGAGTAAQVLQSGGAAADPAYSTATYPLTTGAGEVLLSNAANTVISSTSLTGDFTYTGSAAGAARTLLTTQTDNSNAASHAIISATTGGASGGDPKFQAVVTGVTTWSFGADNTDTDAFVLSQNANLGTSNVIRATKTGIITTPLQSGCSAYLNTATANATGDLTVVPVVFDVEDYDIQSEYDTATGIFTAKQDGIYQVNAIVTFGSLGAAHTIGNMVILRNGVTWWQAQFNPGTCRESANQFSITGSVTMQLAATGTTSVTVVVGNGLKAVSLLNTNYHTLLQVTKIA